MDQDLHHGLISHKLLMTEAGGCKPSASMCQQPAPGGETEHTAGQRLLTSQRRNTDHEQPRDSNKEKEKTLRPRPLPPLALDSVRGRGHRAPIPTAGTASVQSQAHQGAAQMTSALTA